MIDAEGVKTRNPVASRVEDGDLDLAGHNRNITVRVEDGTDDGGGILLARPLSGIPIEKAKRSWLPVAAGPAAGFRRRGRGRGSGLLQ